MVAAAPSSASEAVSTYDLRFESRSGLSDGHEPAGRPFDPPRSTAEVCRFYGGVGKDS